MARRRYYRRRNYRPRFGAVGASFGAMVALDNWRMRGDYYKAYYRNTGKRPHPSKYNKLIRKRIRW